MKRETDFFVSTAKAHGLDVFSPDANDGAEGGLLGEYNEITRAYVDFLHAVGGVGAVEEGLVLLWAMEIVSFVNDCLYDPSGPLRQPPQAYLSSWRNAKSLRPETLTSADPSSLSQTQQALLKFVDNWTSDEFVEFVTDCAEIVDGAGIEIGSALAERCETVSSKCDSLDTAIDQSLQVFKRTLWLEQRFWPSV